MNKRYYWLMKHSNLFHCHLLIFALKCTLTVSWSVPALAQASPMKTIDSKCIFLHSESKENFQQTNWIILFFLIKKCLFVCLFVFGCAGSSLLCALSSWEWRGVSLGGFSGCGAWVWKHGFSSGGTQACLPFSMWNVPRPGIKPMSLVFADGFLSTALPWKSSHPLLKCLIY